MPHRARRSALACTPPKRRRLGDERAAVEEGLRARLGAEVEAQDRADPWPAHVRDVGARLQEAGQRPRGRLLALEADAERRQRAVRQPRLERPGDGPGQRPPRAQLGRPRRVGGRGVAEQQVAVARQVLRAAGDHDVGARGQPGATQRRRQGRVRRDLRAGVVRGGREAGEVEHRQPRVRRRLDPDHARTRQRRPEGRVVAGHEPDVDAARGQVPRGDVADAGVGVARRDEDVAGAERREQHGGHRRHAGGEHHDLAALELGDRRLQALPRRVREAPVAGRVGVAAQVVGRRERRPGQEGLALAGGRQPRVHRARAVAGGPVGAHAADPPGARSHEAKPAARCERSQKGLVPDCPQRHSATDSPAGTRHSPPSGSTSRTGPVTL